MKRLFRRYCSMASAVAVLASSTAFAQCVCTMPASAAGTKYIALTFDDGPNTTTTAEVLDVLEEYEVKASFFLIGSNITDASAANVKRAHDLGCEIDNHSKTHSDMSGMSVTEIQEEVDYVNERVFDITGEYPSFFRPPYISVSDTMFQAIDMPFICGAGCNDWEDDVSAEQRANTVISSAQDGQIILMHDAAGNSQTVEALKTIIPALRSEGYEFVTLNELFKKQGVTPVEDNMYSIVPRSAGAAVYDSATIAAANNAYDIPELDIAKQPLPDNAAIAMLGDMRLGWNLGNTLDAYDDTGWVNGEMNIETCWNGGHKTTQEMIDAVKAAGFRTVRIPVSWHNHVDGDLKISEQWLDRVQEIVDYAVKDDLYVIVNVHHDNTEDNMYPDTAHYESSKKYMTAIWEQVSERFRDYGDKLIFETMNEPRLTGHTNEWWIDFGNADCIDSIKTINKLNQDCVDTIRASGGNNATRYIAVPGYDCSIDGAANQYFEMPQDSADNKIIVAVHAYVPYGFALAEMDDAQSVESFDIDTDTADIEHVMDTIYERYISKGIPSYIGEFACLNKNGNIKSRIDWTAYYEAYATSRGIPCCWWDAPGDMQLLDRSNCTWKYPELVAALNKYAGYEVETSVATTV
ncbi:MAG: cellulase family glycosylhydrolase, partial [Ruminococcus sp.]|nr:cellulase family glycosylhydrolase [Ruminococcus sp.]